MGWSLLEICFPPLFPVVLTVKGLQIIKGKYLIFCLNKKAFLKCAVLSCNINPQIQQVFIQGTLAGMSASSVANGDLFEEVINQI